jgi:hypothetical protein
MDSLSRTRILELAAKADVDERTLKRVLDGGEIRTKSAKRAAHVLRVEGLLPERRRRLGKLVPIESTNPESRSPTSAAATPARVAAART